MVVVLVWAVAVAYPTNLPDRVAYSALALAFLGLAATIPTLVAAVLSGTIADRTNRRRLMQVVSLVAVIATGGLVAALALHSSTTFAVPGPSGFYLPLWMVVAFPLWAAVTATATMFRPAFNASLPRVLPASELGGANGLIYGFAVAISVAGSLAAAALISLVSLSVALLVPLALFIVTGVSTLGLSMETGQVSGRPSSRFSTDVLEGYRYLWRSRAILEMTVSALAINFLSALAFVELGLYVKEWLGVGQAILLGAMTTGASVGSGVGTLIMGRIRFEPNAGRFMVVTAALQGVAILGLALSRSIFVSLPMMFLFGLFPGMSTTVFLATLQATVPNAVLGRVLAADEVGSYGLVPIGQYTGGVITLFAGVQAAFLAAGAGTIAVGAAMSVFRELRTLGFVPKTTPPVAAPGASPMGEGG